MKCELSWLAHPAGMTSRTVRVPGGGEPFPEIEIAFANGYRILFADSRLASLAARSSVPSAESDVLKIVSGIGTPIIHATEAERAAELSEDRPRYLFLLDSKGNLVDNHLAGMDGIYLWREVGRAGPPARVGRRLRAYRFRGAFLDALEALTQRGWNVRIPDAFSGIRTGTGGESEKQGLNPWIACCCSLLPRNEGGEHGIHDLASMHPLPMEEENQREGPGPVAVPQLRKPIAAGMRPLPPDAAAGSWRFDFPVLYSALPRRGPIV